MSVVKSKRGKSRIEFEMNYFSLADGIDNLVENYFWAEQSTVQQHKIFIQSRSEAIERLTDDLVYHIKIANSIYPTCYEEWAERRVEMGKAIGTCYAILTNLQRVMMRLRIPDNKYTNDVKNITKMINSLKAWRKSDNAIKYSFEKK
jgi:hypothetical protein